MKIKSLCSDDSRLIKSVPTISIDKQSLKKLEDSLGEASEQYTVISAPTLASAL